MMRKSVLTAAFGLAATLPLAAIAGPGYNYIEGGYIDIDPDGPGSRDGFFVNGSYGFTPEFHGKIDFDRTKNSPVTLYRTRVMGGYSHALNDTVDLVGRLGWAFYEADISGAPDMDDDGVAAEVGVRGMATPELELNTFLAYDDVEDNAVFSVGGVYSFTPQLGATAGYSYSSDAETVNIGVRFSF